MKFCQRCGQTLSVLEEPDQQLCEPCFSAPEPITPVQEEDADDINTAVLSQVDGKIVLKSKKGWLLWSGNAEEQHSLQQILKRAAHILKVRSKRKK